MNKPLFKNWLKAAYAFKYLKSGLEIFVASQVGQRYSVLKQQVFQQCQQCSMLNQTVCQHIQLCSVCTSNNLLPEHGANGCKRHDCFCTKRPRTRRKCPNNFCSVFYDLIVVDHVYNTPRWSSTDIPAWYNDFIQYAKCFLGSDSPATSLDEIDCTGILSIVIQNRHMHHSINDINLFKKCRVNRNAIFHTGNYEVTDQEVNDYIDDMIHALEDRNSLINDQTANAYVTHLNELRNNQIVITDDDIVELVQKSYAAINELSDEVKQDIEDKRKQVLQVIQDAIQEIKKLKEETVSEQRKQFEELEEEAARQHSERRVTFENLRDDAVRQLSEHTDKDIGRIDDHKHEVIRQISEKSDEAICNIKHALTNVGISSENIRKCLVKIYKEDCGTLPVSPFCDEDEDMMELLSIYKPPSLYHVPYHRTQEQEQYPISSFREIFCKSEHCFRKIYITGEAGVGKTSFCKRMALLWCMSQSGESVRDKGVHDDIDFMSQFDFVFHVSLGKTHRKDIVAMIVEQLFCCENDRKKDATYDSVEHVLTVSKCVIIMDALDEWSPIEHGKININRLFADKCTFITTCRPYKLEKERLSVKDIDRHIQMKGMNESSIKQYVREIVTCINKANGENKDPRDFITEVKKCGLDSQLRIPIIATHLVAVWFDYELTGMSRALLYSNIVDMLLKRAKKTKHIELHDSQEIAVQFPDSLSQLFYLTRHGALLKKISFLSFNVLFKQDKCLSDLVFTTEQLASKPYCVSVQEMDFLCKIGILSRNKVIGQFQKQGQRLSYLHKTYLEFFAALFVSSFDTNNAFDDVVLKKLNTVDDVLQFDTFFCFLVGLFGEKSKSVFENIYSSISDDLSQCRINALARINRGIYLKKCQSLQMMVINCCKEVRQSNNLKISFKLEDYIFYLGDDDVSYSVFQLRTWAKQLVLFNSSPCSDDDNDDDDDDDDVDVDVDVDDDDDDDVVDDDDDDDDDDIGLLKKLLLLNRTCIKTLYSGNGKYFDVFDKVQGLQCLYIGNTDDYEKFNKYLLQKITTLHAIGIKGDGTLIPELPVRNFNQLTSLSLTHVTVQHDSLCNLVKFLAGNVLMEIIRLGFLSCDDHKLGDDDCKLILNLQNHSQLTLLDLCGLIVNILCHNVNTSSLKYIVLSERLTTSASISYIDVLNNITGSKLEYLIMYGDCRYQLDYNTVKILKDVVKSLPYLKQLILGYMNFSDDVVLQLHPDVAHVDIWLSSVTMSRQYFHSFIERFGNIKSVLYRLDECKLTTVDGEVHWEMSHEESMDYMSVYLTSQPNVFNIMCHDDSLIFETSSCQ